MQVNTLRIAYQGESLSLGNVLRTDKLTMRQIDLFIKDFKKMLKESRK